MSGPSCAGRPAPTSSWRRLTTSATRETTKYSTTIPGNLIAAQRTFLRPCAEREVQAHLDAFDIDSSERDCGRARLLSCKTGVGGLLLDTLPTSGQLTAGTDAFGVGLRHCVGLSQAPPTPTLVCECAGRLSRPDHAMDMLKGAWCRIG
jgi:hypothetical protein